MTTLIIVYFILFSYIKHFGILHVYNHTLVTLLCAKVVAYLPRVSQKQKPFMTKVVRKILLL